MSNSALNSITGACTASSPYEQHHNEKAACSLVGRDAELKILLSTFQQQQRASCLATTTANDTSTAVLIHGAPGVGKTAFVNALREPVVSGQGLICMGTFYPQNGAISHQQEPYSAFLEAFSELCDLLLHRCNQGDEDEGNLFDKYKIEIRSALQGRDGAVLSSVIPSLATLLDHPPEDILVASNDHKANFAAAFKRFICSVAIPDHPVVVVLDNIQWMDQDSHQLIKLLMKQEEEAEEGPSSNLLFVFLYRDTKSSTIKQLFECFEGSVIDIELKNLNENEVHQLVSLALNYNGDKVKALSSLIHLQTSGNPFHALQFLEMLEREKLLTKTDVSSKVDNNLAWEFDVQSIQQNNAKSLADVLSRKIQQLDKGMLQILQVASILGICFEKSVLQRLFVDVAESQKRATNDDNEIILRSRESIQIQNDLLRAAEMGFIKRVNDDNYQFSHETMQSVLHGMVDVTTRQEIHRAMAETYQRNGDPKSEYFAAIHFNQAKEILALDRLQVARINVAASKYCNRIFASCKSAVLLREALEYISEEDRWTINYDLTLEIFNLLLQDEAAVGNHEACKAISNEIIMHAKSPEDKMAASVAILDCNLAQYNTTIFGESVRKAVQVLGFKIPIKIGMARVLRKLIRIKFMLRGQTDESILSLPILSDKVRAMQVKVLLYNSTSGMAENDPVRSIYSALLAMEICLKEGRLSPYVPSAFAIYSVAELAMGNRDRAFRYGRLVMSMIDQMDCRATEAPAILLVTTLVLHWRQHLRDLVEPLNRCKTSGLESRDMFFAILGAANYVGVRFFKGDSLVELEEYVRTTFPTLDAVGNGDIIGWLKPSFQQVLNLRANADDWRTLTELKGDIMVESNYIRAAVAINEKIQLNMLWLCKLPLAYHFHFFSQAESVLMDLYQNWQSFRSTYNYMTYHFYGALTYLELFRIHGLRKYLRMAKRSRRALEKPPTPNSLPLVALLVAEEKSVHTKHVVTLEKLYSAAIQSMANAGFSHMEALANERAGFLFCKLGHEIKAERYFLRAMELYEFEWGATAKYEWLLEQSDSLLAGANAAHQTGENNFGGNMSVVEERSSEFTAN